MDQASQLTGGEASAGQSAGPAFDADFHASELAARIKRLIRRRTGSGINQLRVDVGNQTIRIAGHCSTFYCRQLAQQAAMQLGGQRVIDDQVTVAEYGEDS